MTAVKPTTVFQVDVENVVGDVTFDVKSFKILSSGSRVKLAVNSVRKQVYVSADFLSAPSGGSFSLDVAKVGTFVLNGNAFDVLDNVSFTGLCGFADF